MTEHRILATGRLLPVVEEFLRPFGRIEIAHDTDEESLVALMPNTVALIARGVTPISKRIIAAGSDLRVIGRTGAGYDSIDIDAATDRGIPVVYAPKTGSRAVAEGTLSMILALAKRLRDLDQSIRAGEWAARDSFALGDLEGSILGIVGLGSIGREVARLAKAFEMRILSYDPFLSKEQAESVGSESVELNFLLRESDYISLHVPLNQQTRGMISRQCLTEIKHGAVLLNLARGGLVESLDVLKEALDSGRLSAVGLDVYPQEPPDLSHPFFACKNTLCTPHVMSLTAKAAQAIFAAVSRGIAEVLSGKIPEDVVNPEVFESLAKESTKGVSAVSK